MAGYRVANYKPFDPVSKRTEASCLNIAKKTMMTVTKGAPQVILSVTGQDGKLLKEVATAVDAFAKKGYRTLAVAEGDSKSRPRIVGLIVLYDPPREDSKSTIRSAAAMGVDVKMVTGDHVAIAREMCKEVGIGTDIMLTQELNDPATTTSAIEKANVFAEVFPENKYAIVEKLQARGHIVGMTGDGVNDAPALKKADAGIAVSGATDAARSAADIVLTKGGLSVITDAITHSRMIFERMNSYAIYRIAETIRVLLLISLAIIVLNFYPLTVLMLVLLALLNDFPIMMIAYDNAPMAEKPMRWNMERILSESTFLGAMGVVSSFTLLLLGVYVFHLSTPVLETLMFLKLLVAGHMTLYLARSGKKHFWNRPLPSPRLFAVVETTQLAATLLVLSGLLLPPLSLGLVAFVWTYALMFFVINDFGKVAFLRYLDSRNGRTSNRPITPSTIA
ncbi:Potassium-transporting ATPase ATP-binding subunit [uncultured archaeon]|nr:Potassium-transporting ATPase ATP-binding subunit [uncultured archaeon]